MAYRYGNRHQRLLLPPSVEEYVPADAPVRVYDAIVDRLDLGALGLVEEPGQEGCPRYDLQRCRLRGLRAGRPD